MRSQVLFPATYSIAGLLVTDGLVWSTEVDKEGLHGASCAVFSRNICNQSFSFTENLLPFMQDQLRSQWKFTKVCINNDIQMKVITCRCISGSGTVQFSDQCFILGMRLEQHSTIACNVHHITTFTNLVSIFNEFLTHQPICLDLVKIRNDLLWWMLQLLKPIATTW